MKRIFSLLVTLALVSSFAISCANVDPYPSSQRTYEGAAVGTALGSVAGLLIDKDNRWRGAVIGGLLGAAVGGTLVEISQRAAREAAYRQEPVYYETTGQGGVQQRVEAYPVGYNENTGCHRVREKVYQNGQLKYDQVREVCETSRY